MSHSKVPEVKGKPSKLKMVFSVCIFLKTFYQYKTFKMFPQLC